MITCCNPRSVPLNDALTPLCGSGLPSGSGARNSGWVGSTPLASRAASRRPQHGPKFVQRQSASMPAVCPFAAPSLPRRLAKPLNQRRFLRRDRCPAISLTPRREENSKEIVELFRLKTVDICLNASIFDFCCHTKNHALCAVMVNLKGTRYSHNEKNDLFGTLPGFGPCIRSWLQEERRSSGTGS